jgi:hypothetical protein
MNLLHPLQIVMLGWSICEGPHSQIVHVRHHGPRMLEGHLLAWLQEAVLVGCLSVASADAAPISELLLGRFEIGQLVHFFYY